MTDALTALQPVVYGLVALATLARFARSRDAASGWAAATFVVLTAVVVIGQVTGDDPDGRGLVQRFLVVGIVAFPYLLFRFARTFRPAHPALEVAAAVLTAVAAGLIFAFDQLPGEGEDPTAAFQAYTALVVVQWNGLSLLVAVWLWRGGSDRPTLVRRRMRVLASGALALALALLLAGVAGEVDHAGIDLAISALAIMAAPLFLAGLAPPVALVERWRRPDEERLRQVEKDLVAATSPGDVGAAMLPFVARALGGGAAVLTRGGDEVVASYGVERPEDLRTLLAVDATRAGDVMAVELASGRLTVAADPYAPFFGREEEAVIARLGGLTDVALRRAEIAERERAAADEAVRAREAMRDFVALASHDLRTPIAVVKGYAATMTASWSALPDDDKQRFVEIIGRQASHLGRMVDDLLTVSRIDVGAVDPLLEPVELAAVVDELLEDIDRAGDVQVDLDGAAAVWADEEHLGRSIRNLVENAFHYGAPPVTITASTSDGAVEIRVRDHGPGVPASFRPRLFARFARADKTASASKQGTGLGLAIVRGLARSGGGDAWYEPVDPGACFVIRFPAVPETAS